MMKQSKFSEERIAYILRQAEGGTTAIEVCRQNNISEQTFYRWKKKYGGMGVPELRRGSRSKERFCPSNSRASFCARGIGVQEEHLLDLRKMRKRQTMLTRDQSYANDADLKNFDVDLKFETTFI